MFAALLSVSRAQSIDPLTVDGDPMVLSWVRPEYPSVLQDQKLQGHVIVQVVIEPNGTQRDLQVTETTDERFNSPVVEALKQWRFHPGVYQGRPVAAGVEIRWVFVLPYPPQDRLPPPDAFPRVLPKADAYAEFVPEPTYPKSLLNRRIDGEVVCQVDISAAGDVGGLKILNATHGDFVVASADVLRQWRFHPALQGQLKVPDQKIVPMTFVYDLSEATDGITPLAANGFSLDLPAGARPSEVCDVQPLVIATTDPVYPPELLGTGEAAEAEVSFVLPITGVPQDIRVEQASLRSAGAAVAASIRASLFKPALKDGSALEVRMQRNYRFKLPTSEPDEGEAHPARLLRAMRNGQTVASAKGLDAKLAPLWRMPPQYPLELVEARASGSAEIEFIIDPEGRARLPKVVTATHEAFGWSAATAVSQWVFERPTRNGAPTDVRVRIPIGFSPPQ